MFAADICDDKAPLDLWPARMVMAAAAIYLSPERMAGPPPPHALSACGCICMSRHGCIGPTTAAVTAFVGGDRLRARERARDHTTKQAEEEEDTDPPPTATAR
jgi:hypothetical protein